MGAMVSFELMRELRRRGLRLPSVYFPAGRRAPQIADEDPPIHGLPDDAFVATLLREYRATLPAVMENAELRDLMLPMLRADFELCETYRHEPEPPFDCPIVALGGADDPDPTEAQLVSWKEMTTGTFRHFIFAGDHFFIDSSRAQVIQLVRNIMQAAL
jgi:medium-chain acyl-[acyl-carrier-protein] hydrolase